MEKYSESVKEAQEKLEQAEKKATDVCRRVSNSSPARALDLRGGGGVKEEGGLIWKASVGKTVRIPFLQC